MSHLTRAILLFLVLTPSVFADEVVLKNGDRITGTITSSDGKKLTLKTKALSDLTIDMKDVATFITDAPARLKLKDGEHVKAKVDAGEPGTVQIADPERRAVPVTEFKYVNPPFETWTGALLLGGSLTRGNSDTENLNFSAEAVRRTEIDRISLDAGYLFGREKDPATGSKSTTTDAWFAAAKYDYFFTEKFYGYGLFRVEHDRIADVNVRLLPFAGVGYQWVESDDFNFNTEAGLGYVYEDFTNAPTDGHFAARLAYHVDKKINDKVKLFHNLEYFPSLEDISDFNVDADAGIRATLTKSFFTEFKVQWKYDATPSPTAAKNDLRYLLSLGWTF